MKKLLAILLIVLIVFVLSVNAFAASDGSITISNTTKGETYTLYKIFGATIEKSNNPVSVAYTYNGTLGTNDYFEQDASGNITVKTAGKDSSGHLTEGAVTFLGTIKGTAVKTEEAKANTVTFDGLDYGYYYIESTLGAKAVSVDTTTPNATLIDKNQGPAWYDSEGKVTLGKYIVADTNTANYDPKVTENSVNFGDTVTFEVSFNATDYVGEEKVLTYYLTDTICEGFEIDKSSLKVYFDGSEKTKGTEYKVFWNDSGRTFTVSAPWATDAGTSKYEANVVIKLTYNAKLLTNAVIASPGNPNTAYFDYRIGSDTRPVDSENPNNPFTPPASPYRKSEEKKTVTYTYAVGLTKIDGKDKKVLKGAEFSLFKGTDTTPIKATATETLGVYNLDPDGTVTEFAINNSGVLVIKGLKEGEYTLKETKAPSGYNRALNGTTVEFKKADLTKYGEEHTVYFDEAGNETTTVTGTTVTTDYNVNVLGLVFENERGVELPVTGGMGTTLFYIVGGALALGAFVLLVAKKRMKSKE